MLSIFFFIAFVSACFGVVWVSILTHYTGALHFLTRYYPKRLSYLLTCNVCLSGWIAGGAMTYLYQWLLIVPCMVVAMVFSYVLREKGGFQ